MRMATVIAQAKQIVLWAAAGALTFFISSFAVTYVLVFIGVLARSWFGVTDGFPTGFSWRNEIGPGSCFGVLHGWLILATKPRNWRRAASLGLPIITSFLLARQAMLGEFIWDYRTAIIFLWPLSIGVLATTLLAWQGRRTEW